MKKSTKSIINILCYIGIFILVIIMALPPLLRFLLPDNDDFENEIKLELLSCEKIEPITNTEKVINTHYKNDEVVKINITYTNVIESSIIDEKDYYNLNGVEVDDTKESIINIEITPNSFNKVRLSPILKSINEQKSIYEDGDYNYTCNITSDS